MFRLNSTTEPTVEGRIAKIRETLADVSDSMANRDMLIEIERRKGVSSYNFLNRDNGNAAWHSAVSLHTRIYNQVIASMENVANPTAAQLLRWEQSTERLRKWTLNRSERIFENDDYGNFEPVEGIFKQDWSFETAWGGGPAEGIESLDPSTKAPVDQPDAGNQASGKDGKNANS